MGTTAKWQQRGACRGEAGVDFYPPMEHGAQARAGRPRAAGQGRVRVLSGTLDCLEHAVTADERYGIWGGLTQDERRHLRRSA